MITDPAPTADQCTCGAAVGSMHAPDCWSLKVAPGSTAGS